MKTRTIIIAAVILCIATIKTTSAQEPPVLSGDLESRVQALENENLALQDEVAVIEDTNAALQDQVTALADAVTTLQAAIPPQPPAP
jgi:hypothetical protein